MVNLNTLNLTCWSYEYYPWYSYGEWFLPQYCLNYNILRVIIRIKSLLKLILWRQIWKQE
jgi:hypothetical protein